MKNKQLSETALRERIRKHVPSLIEEAVTIAKNGDNDNARISAIKFLISKCISDPKTSNLISVEKNEESGKTTKEVANLLQKIISEDD